MHDFFMEMYEYGYDFVLFRNFRVLAMFPDFKMAADEKVITK